MYCGNCGKELNNDVVFCKYCGAKVDDVNEANSNDKSNGNINVNNVPLNNKSQPVKENKGSKAKIIIPIVSAAVVVIGIVVLLVVLLSSIRGIGNSSTTNTTSGTIFLDDKAGLLTSTESKSVLEELTKESEGSNCVITVITTNEGLSESEIQSYSDNYYSRIIEDKSNINFSVILTVDISSRKVDVRTFNPGSKRNLNSSELNKLREYVTDDLSNGDYEEAFIKFADKASSMAGNISESGERV